jgi:hypothetical protein
MYLTFCTFPLNLKKVACLIQDAVSPHCGDKRMAQHCTRHSLPNYMSWCHIMSSLLCEPVSLRVVMQLVHTIGKIWYKVLYQHTMYVISLSNISMKKQILNYHHTVVIKEWHNIAQDIPCRTTCHDVISLECSEKHIYVTTTNNITSCTKCSLP